MVILASTITISVELQTLIIFLLFVVILGIFVYFNILKFKRFEEITRYKDHKYNNSYRHLDNCLRFCGLITVPLFKNIMIDARHFIYFQSCQMNWLSESMYRMNDEDQTERKREKVLFERGMKLLKLKYKRKPFVVRKVFTIFVSK